MLSLRKNIVLIGMMGVGKTTLGKIVAKHKKLEFIDTDVVIEQKNSMTIREIFKNKGEKFFRIEEENVILESLKKDNCVIALGGGAFINKIVRENILRKAISIWLDVNIQTLSKRASRSEKRPLLTKENRSEKLNELYVKRKNIYKLANHKIECEEHDREIIAKKIIELYEKY